MIKVNEKYSQFFFTSRCITSSVDKMVPVLDPIHLKGFIETLLGDNAEEDIKLLVGLMFSAGMRVSECLSLKRSDFRKESDGSYTILINVLKKRKSDITREGTAHPLMNGLIAKKLTSKRYNEFIFRERATKRSPAKELTRRKALHSVKKVFGESMTNHALRHSNVALLMHLKYTHVQISSMLKMSVSNVANYAHVNTAREMRNVFAGA